MNLATDSARDHDGQTQQAKRDERPAWCDVFDVLLGGTNDAPECQTTTEERKKRDLGTGPAHELVGGNSDIGSTSEISIGAAELSPSSCVSRASSWDIRKHDEVHVTALFLCLCSIYAMFFTAGKIHRYVVRKRQERQKISQGNDPESVSCALLNDKEEVEQ